METLEITIDDVAAGGDGLGHAPDGRVVFVPSALRGERVRVRVVDDRPRMVRAELADVLDASPGRIEAACPHVAAGCGGCGWQHVSLEEQRHAKVRIAEEALRRIGRLPGVVEHGSPLPGEGFRTTVRCLVKGGRAAFRAAGSHEPVPVDSCLVAHPGIDELIQRGRFGDAAEVTLRVGAMTGERLAVLAPRVPDGIDLPDDVRVVGADELASGRRAWFADEVAGHRFRISADSFFQTRTDGAEALVSAVRDAGAGTWGIGHLVDLYGGVGLFSAVLGHGMRVTIVEANRAAAADARHNTRHLDATVVRVSAERWRPSTADVVVADPPRAGLGARVVETIGATAARRVALVSCDPAAFGRDARLLADVGFERRWTRTVDLFPHTPHVELISRFDRVDGLDRGEHRT